MIHDLKTGHCFSSLTEAIMFLNSWLPIPSSHPASYPSSSGRNYGIVVLWGAVMLDCLHMRTYNKNMLYPISNLLSFPVIWISLSDVLSFLFLFLCFLSLSFFFDWAEQGLWKYRVISYWRRVKAISGIFSLLQSLTNCILVVHLCRDYFAILFYFIIYSK